MFDRGFPCYAHYPDTVEVEAALVAKAFPLQIRVVIAFLIARPWSARTPVCDCSNIWTGKEEQPPRWTATILLAVQANPHTSCDDPYLARRIDTPQPFPQSWCGGGFKKKERERDSSEPKMGTMTVDSLPISHCRWLPECHNLAAAPGPRASRRFRHVSAFSRGRGKSRFRPHPGSPTARGGVKKGGREGGRGGWGGGGGGGGRRSAIIDFWKESPRIAIVPTSDLALAT